ncbi:MAG: isoleucine--tRNA ligase [Bacillota bacterium]
MSFGRPQGLDSPALERQVQRFWEKSNLRRRLREREAGRPAFAFWEGPPTANGRPHIGHAIPRVMKDLFIRYRSMQGYRITRKAGWDTHGLPVELEVEKEMGLEGKDHIEKHGVEEFVASCRRSVFRYQREWEYFTERLGFWLDLDEAYITCTDEYIESVWWALRRLWDQGLIYRGHRVVPYCPRCGTALSSHEVAQGYQETEDPSVFVRFTDTADPSRHFLVWTTTPWTLPSNVGVAVDPQLEYVEVELEGERLVVAAARREAVLPTGRVLRTFPGSELVGTPYRPLFDFLKLAAEGEDVEATGGGKPRAAFVIVAGGFVGAEDGTGLVHLAPPFGEDDYLAAREIGLPWFQPVDPQGRFTHQVPPWSGQPVKDADVGIVAELKRTGLLFSAGTVVHTYPFCWRCDTPLLYYARSSWFMAVTRLRERLLELNATVRWQPETVGSGRFGNFLEQLVDYNISRERYWGTPLNIWLCPRCGCQHCVKSLEELRRMAVSLPTPMELHRPGIDRVRLRCPECQQEMERTPEVLDCWFDSGAMPFAQWHYPFAGQEEFAENFPADFICEAVDQTRGWFYTLLVVNGALFDRAPFRSVLVTEFGLDEQGQKMSKHKGNVVDPMEVMDRLGTDALRWFVCSTSSPWHPKRFSQEAIAKNWWQLAGTLWNTWAFLDLYTRTSGLDPGDPPQAPLLALDRWIFSRMSATVEEFAAALEDLDPAPACRALSRLVDELSNWYVRRSRARFWGTGDDGPDQRAFYVLHQVLATTARLLAPVVPFFAEALHQNLGAPGALSVHLADFPRAGERDHELEQAMSEVMAYVNLGRAARQRAGIRTRQPLRAVMLAGPGAGLMAEHGSQLESLLASELNVKLVRYGIPAGNAGPAEEDGLRRLALDTMLDRKLQAEGLAREVVHRIQRLRREAGFEISDRIITYYHGDEQATSAIEEHHDYICRETLTLRLAGELPPARAFGQETDIDGQKITLAVERVREVSL